MEGGVGREEGTGARAQRSSLARTGTSLTAEPGGADGENLPANRKGQLLLNQPYVFQHRDLLRSAAGGLGRRASTVAHVKEKIKSGESGGLQRGWRKTHA